MDKWSEDQIKKMQLGGNRKCMEFFKAHPDWREGMTIQEKYQSEFAKLYKEKLQAECDGRPWTMPTRTYSPRPVARPQQVSQDGGGGSRVASGSNLSSSFNSNNGNARSHGMGGGGGMGGGSGSIGGIGPKTDKERNEDYFHQKGLENNTRSDNLPPSQGGKYVGFVAPTSSTSNRGGGMPDPLEDPLGALTKGFSFFASTTVSALTEGTKLAISGAEVLGQKLTETVIDPTTKAVRDPDFGRNVSSYVSTFQQKVTSGVSSLVKEGTNLVQSAGILQGGSGGGGGFGGSQYSNQNRGGGGGGGLDDFHNLSAMLNDDDFGRVPQKQPQQQQQNNDTSRSNGHTNGGDGGAWGNNSWDNPPPAYNSSSESTSGNRANPPPSTTTNLSQQQQQDGWGSWGDSPTSLSSSPKEKPNQPDIPISSSSTVTTTNKPTLTTATPRNKASTTKSSTSTDASSATSGGGGWNNDKWDDF